MFNLEDYETVEERLTKFWKDHPQGRVETKLIINTPSQYIVWSAIYRDAADVQPWATGLAEETVQGRGVNATSALENCETSSLGRSLANAGYATKGKRASREEMTKVAKATEVKASIDQVKAKMADTSQQYVPVAKADDPWTTWESPAPQTMETAVETVKQVLGGTTPEESCSHGARVWKTGVSKAGKTWGMWKCNPPHGTSNYCDPIWYSIADDGTWKPRAN
jgi:hypothetical protein